MVKKIGLGSAVAISALIVFAACGNSGNNRLSKAEFTKKANAACTNAEKKITADTADVTKELQAGLTSPTAAADVAKTLAKVSKDYRGLIDDLKSLKPPENLDSAYKKALSAGDTSAKGIDQAQAKAKAGNLPESIAILTKSGADQKANVAPFFQTNGISVCAKGFSSSG